MTNPNKFVKGGWIREPEKRLPDDIREGYWPAQQLGEECIVPPAGWRCLLKRGHDGPCATLRDER